MRRSDSSQVDTQVAGFPIVGTPEDGDVLTYDAGTWVPEAPAGLAIAEASVATSSLADDAVDSSKTLAIGKMGTILKVEVDEIAWVRLYINEAARTADLARDIATAPTEGDGVITDTYHANGEALAGVVQLSPAAIYYNDEDPVTEVIPITVQNLSGDTSVINVTVTYVRQV